MTTGFKIEGVALQRMNELIPGHMTPGWVRYFEEGVEGGHFMMAILRNDLMKAVEHADMTNRAAIPNYAVWLYNYAPIGSYGSAKNVKAWMRDGLEGVAA